MSRFERGVLYHIAAASTGFVMLLLGALLSVVMMPGSWFVSYDLDVIAATAEDPEIVIQTRWMLAPVAYDGTWTASVEEIPEGQGYTRRVCVGGASDTYSPDKLVFRESLQRWVGDPDCALKSGERYRIEATWAFEVFGMIAKETSAVSEAFIAR